MSLCDGSAPHTYIVGSLILGAISMTNAPNLLVLLLSVGCFVLAIIHMWRSTANEHD